MPASKTADSERQMSEMLLWILVAVTLSATPSEASSGQDHADPCHPGTQQASSLHCLSQKDRHLPEEGHHPEPLHHKKRIVCSMIQPSC